ncbi:MAG: HNH endonuclease [Chloroflexi bacterium]|nr:HNH endonuclease [Chloroflexota bacterium]
MVTPSNLPPSPRLPVEHLSGSFNNVTNSYKFYWFLALLDHFKETQSPLIPVNYLLARMVAGVWYPANYFRLSFGKQDRLSQIALAIKAEINLPTDTPKQKIIKATLDYMGNGTPLAREIVSLGDYVPFRFLRPFFATELRGEVDWKINALIQQMADDSFINSATPCLYRFQPQTGLIEIHPRWLAYLQEHLTIVTGFCLWHLLNYLQKNNPNVPNIAAKLFEPETRNLNASRRFWQQAFDAMGTICCIYSGQAMSKAAFSLDHFLPWSFVAHDLLWNLIPTPKNVNSAKSDQLPDFALHFGPFARLQYDAFQAIATPQKERALEDYVLLFKRPSIRDIQTMPFDDFQQTLRDTIAPQIQIARNMGFTADWRYVP